MGSNPITRTSQSEPFLTNSRAVIYPIIYNEHSGEYMPTPYRTDLQRIPNSERVPWNPTLRANYIRDYIDTYGDPQWDWAPIDIHHVVQRQYGGTNSFDNLYPLPRELHQQVVERWWDHY
ncbi:HNH endonuclease signature motif containing protein [Virgibacillus kimchii]